MTSSPPPSPVPSPASPPQDAAAPPPALSPSPSIPPQPPENNPPSDFSPPAAPPPAELPLPPSPPVGVTPPPIPEAVAPVPAGTLPVKSPPPPSMPIVVPPISPNDPPQWSPQPSFPSPSPPSEHHVPPSTTLPSSHPSSTHPSYIGLIIGTTIGGVATVILLLVLIILLICLKKKKINHECPPPKDKPNGVLPLQWKQRFPPQGSNVVPFHWNPFPLPPPLLPQLSSSTEDASDDNFTLRSQSSLTGGNFTYDELALATGDFSSANLLGEGGFGYVHKGILPTGRQIAVKQLKTGSRQGEREFQAEVETISRVHHRHLVSLVGYCMTGAERLLVYEFVPNKTLYVHLHGIGQPVMEWATRMKIAIGSAKGLAYLHEDCNPTIIHRDIKASNILLDNKFEAKVSDFGLAKFFSDTNHDVTHVYTRVVGTFGYLAPEYAASGKASDRSDTFSFGVVLLELITGRPPINRTDSLANDSLVTWARPLLTQAMENGKFDLLVDPKLQGNYNDKEMKTMVACAAACVRHSAWRRPHMSQVVRALEGDVSLTDLEEGVRPGQSTLCSPINIPYYNMEEFRLMSDFYTRLVNEENDTSRNYGSSGTAEIPHESERCKRADQSK